MILNSPATWNRWAVALLAGGLIRSNDANVNRVAELMALPAGGLTPSGQMAR